MKKHDGSKIDRILEQLREQDDQQAVEEVISTRRNEPVESENIMVYETQESINIEEEEFVNTDEEMIDVEEEKFVTPDEEIVNVEEIDVNEELIHIEEKEEEEIEEESRENEENEESEEEEEEELIDDDVQVRFSLNKLY